MSGDHAVLVLDDDRFIRAGLERLLAAHGYKVRLHAEPDELFRNGMPQVPACLLLDNQLGDGMTGVEVHEELLRRGWFIPTVFLTAHWNVQFVVNAIRAGADGFLTKPFDPTELVDAVALALQRSRSNRQGEFAAAEARVRVASLTPRERDIVRLVVEGLLNKEIADQLDLALITVKVHRGRAMHKLAAGNPAEMVHIAGLGGIGR
ncbi:MAG: response regulator transcription factor [Verrucomicrobia bacterium]|nr:MAG: response regulator transcription factor [Verrucomicrobiota bacterium]